MFEGLFNLTTLNFQSNQIESISELAFAPLRNLQVLDLTKNVLSHTSVTVSIFLSCPLLQTLYLRGNHFTSFKSESFPFPLNISELYLGSQPLHSFVLHSDLLPHLESLSLSGLHSDFQWDVSDKSFLTNVKILDLSYSNFTLETYKSIFSSVTSLENLDLSNVSLFDKRLLDLACAIPSLQELHVRDNAISVLDNSFFQLCVHLTYLDLSENSMTNMSESSLQILTGLSTLDVEQNSLTEVPLTIRNMSSLIYMYLTKNQIKKLHCLDFANLWNLIELSLYENRLTELDSCAFQDLHSLKILDLNKNYLLQFDDSFGIRLSNLEYLSADNVAWLQRGVFKNMSHLKNLGLDSTKGTIVEEGIWDGLTELVQLSYSPPTIFQTNLDVISNSSTRGLSLYQQGFNLPFLQSLYITVSTETCFIYPDDFFRGLDNLKEFTCFNLFCAPPVNKKTFLYTPLLKVLKISDNKVLSLYPELFHPIGHLQSLELSYNQLNSLDFLLQANLTELQSLNLENNDLSVINESVFEALPSLKYLQLSNNPFVCNCSNAGFIHWARTNKQVFVDRAFQFKCVSPPSQEGHLLLEFNTQSCLEYTDFFCFISTSALVLFTLLSSFICHFLRWQLVYSFYLLRAYLYHTKKRRHGCEDIYDAFVSYNVHDEDWVYRQLVPELEERQGWRLCLHHRDFQPGRAIMENITDAIYSSRKTLCVISQRYLRSEWCSREIQMASFRLLDEKKDVLILLFLEDLSSNQLSPFYRMRKLLRSRTYLNWSQAQNHTGLFWEKVRRALQSGAKLTNNPLPAQV
nr:TLR23o [Mugilogobius chulae]